MKPTTKLLALWISGAILLMTGWKLNYALIGHEVLQVFAILMVCVSGALFNEISHVVNEEI